MTQCNGIMQDKKPCEHRIEDYPPMHRFNHDGLDYCVHCMSKLRIDPKTGEIEFFYH